MFSPYLFSLLLSLTLPRPSMGFLDLLYKLATSSLILILHQDCDSKQSVTASNSLLRRGGRGHSRSVWKGLERCLSGSEICYGC